MIKQYVIDINAHKRFEKGRFVVKQCADDADAHNVNTATGLSARQIRE